MHDQKVNIVKDTFMSITKLVSEFVMY